MANNSKRAHNGIEYYENKIYQYADEYINNLDLPDDETPEKMIRKTPIFKGMLKYINSKCFKLKKTDIIYNNKNSNLDYSDIDTINNIWSIYTDLCYRYLQVPTLLNFSLLTGITSETFNTWKNNEYRSSVDGISTAHSSSVKKWLKECESALYDGAMSGNPGPMFLLKANYGYTEAPQQVIVTGSGTPQLSADDLARLRAERQPEALPEKPVIDI